MGDVQYPGGVRLTAEQHYALQLQGLHSEGGAVSEAALAIGEPSVADPEPVDALGQEPDEAMRPEDYPPEDTEDEQPDVPEPESPQPDNGPTVEFEPDIELSEHPDFNQEPKPLIAPADPPEGASEQFGIEPFGEIHDPQPDGNHAPQNADE